MSVQGPSDESRGDHMVAFLYKGVAQRIQRGVLEEMIGIGISITIGAILIFVGLCYVQAEIKNVAFQLNELRMELKRYLG